MEFDNVRDAEDAIRKLDGKTPCLLPLLTASASCAYQGLHYLYYFVRLPSDDIQILSPDWVMHDRCHNCDMQLD